MKEKEKKYTIKKRHHMASLNILQIPFFMRLLHPLSFHKLGMIQSIQTMNKISSNNRNTTQHT